MDDEVLKQKYMQYRYLQEQIEELQKHLERVKEQEGQYLSTVAAIEDLKNIEAGAEMQVPIANGIFVKGTIMNPQELLVNVGAGVVCSKSLQETSALLTRQNSSIKEVEDQLMAQYTAVAKKMELLETELSKVVE